MRRRRRGGDADPAPPPDSTGDTANLGDTADAEPPATRGESHRAAVRLRRRRRRMRRTGWVCLLFGLLAVGTGLWVTVTAVAARSHLMAVASGMTQLEQHVRDGDTDAARADTARAASEAGAAHRLTGGPAWWVAARVPFVGDPVRTVQGVTDAAYVLTSSVVPSVVDASVDLDPATLRRADGSIDVARIAEVAPTVIAATDRVRAVAYDLRQLPRTTWLGAVDDARATVADTVGRFAGSLTGVDTAVRTLPALLGADGRPRTYFVGFQNNAESRGSGGVPGAFGILRVGDGRFEFVHFGDDSEFDGVRTSLDLGPDFTAHYGSFAPTTTYLNSTVSPDFADTGRIWTAMWAAKTGQRLDGAMSLDPTALSYLLAATGPATLADGTTVSADNVVALTQADAYAKFPNGDDNAARRAYLRDIARTVDEHVVSASADSTTMLQQVRRAVDERRLLVWSADPAVQADLADTALGGTLPTGEGAFAGVVLDQAQPTKLDYYLDGSMAWARSGCGDRRDVTVTVTLRNSAPASGLPVYVTGLPGTTTGPAGTNVLMLDYLATTGSRLLGATVDGRPAYVESATQAGHPAWRFEVAIAPGATSTVVLRLHEPAAAGGTPIVLRQPLVHPLEVTTSDSSC
ncbi:DUF4012 domain-containing protein [Jatrophihabitans sp. YIM 134969]